VLIGSYEDGPDLVSMARAYEGLDGYAARRPQETAVVVLEPPP